MPQRAPLRVIELIALLVIAAVLSAVLLPRFNRPASPQSEKDSAQTATHP